MSKTERIRISARKLVNVLALVWLVAAVPSFAFAQGPLNIDGGSIVYVQFPGVPTGSCSVEQVARNGSNGDFFNCFSGAWLKVNGGAGGSVSSVFGRTGVVTAQANDYSFAQISGTATDAQLTGAYSGVGACGANTWASTLARNAAPTCTQPAFSNLSGVAAAGQLPVFIASGASHAIGAVPDPGASAGTTRFLREDSTWTVPPGGSSSVPFGTDATNTNAYVVTFSPAISSLSAGTLAIMAPRPTPQEL